MLSQHQQILEQIKKANNILITFNKTWNGDAVASALALFLFLNKMEKNVEIAAECFEKAGQFAFLPSYEKISTNFENIRKFIISLDTANAKVGKIKYLVEDNSINFIISPKEGFFTHDDIKSRSGDFKYDLIIVIDTPDLESLGTIYEKEAEFFYQVPVINIDHHAYNEEFGQINLVEITAGATSEILFKFFNEYSSDSIDEGMATCLLAGIISKTKNFKTQNITPQLLSAASKLISLGGQREEIVNKLYRSRTLNVLKLWGRVLARLTSDFNDKLVWSVLTDSDFKKTSTSEDDLPEVIDELIVNIPKAEIISLIYEIDQANGNGQKNTHAIIYSVKNLNCLEISRPLNPVGTKKMAKIKLSGGIQEAEKLISETIKKNFENLPI
jgi:bifunctional oligoribonuclease and PAP phosphatase NrnA